MSQMRRDVPATQGNAPVTGWTVTSQQQTIQTDQSGRITRGVEVYFRLPSGTGGSVFVPESGYNPANVKAAIAQQAARMAEVDNLQG